MKTLLFFCLGVTTALGYHASKKIDTGFSKAAIIANSSNSFGFEVLKELSNTQNALISPISISILMSLLYSGARYQTALEIQKVMQYPPSVREGIKELLNSIKPIEGVKANTKSYDLEMATAMLVDKEFNIRQSFKDDSRNFYDAAVENVSFDVDPEDIILSVNGWVALRTHKKITKVLEESLDPLTKLFLMNAVYFKGTWKTKFDQRFTMPDTFYNDGLIPKTVPMMRQKRKLRYGFDTKLQAHALEIPYDGDDIKMLLLLPEKRDGLSDMENLISNELLGEITSHLREVIVQVTLPRFSLEEDYDLISILKKMGIHSLFNSDASDLSGISPKQGLYVTKAIHKSAIEVNEEGSEAASVTGVSAGVRTGGPLGPVFNADHPFLFFIHDSRLDLILFIGRVAKL